RHDGRSRGGRPGERARRPSRRFSLQPRVDPRNPVQRIGETPRARAAPAHRGAQHAQALLAYEDAARLYEMAIAALELDRPADLRLRCELLLNLGEAL